MLTNNIMVNLLVLICLLPALVRGCCTGDQCSCEPNCWEKCFLEPSKDSYLNPYKEIYGMAVGVRNLYLPCSKPHGTAYMLDADVPTTGVSAGDLYLYQRQLAGIVAMVQPVGDDCNPFCASKFYANFGFYVHNWPCKNRCEAMNFLSVSPPASISSFAQRPGVPSSWVRGGEILSRLCFDRPHLRGHECMNCTTNELLIAFTNSPVITQPSICDNGRFSCVAVGVHPADLQDNDDWAKTGNAYHLPSTTIYRQAARKITSCLRNSCCSTRGIEPLPISPVRRKQRKEEKEETFHLITQTDELGKNVTGTFSDFQEDHLEPLINPKKG